MTDVFLHGFLGEEFGEKWELEISKPVEALAAIEANTRRFFKFISDESRKNIKYVIKVNDRHIEEESNLKLNYVNLDKVDIIPVPEGSALFTTIAGSTLLAAVANAAVMAVASTLISLVVSGVVNMMFKPPTPPTPPGNVVVESNTSQTTSSYVISGPINNERQGMPVPIGYGRLKVGSMVMSSALRDKMKPKNYLQTSSNAGLGSWSTRGRESTEGGFAIQGKNTAGLESIQAESYIGPTNGFIDNSAQQAIADIRSLSQEIIQYHNSGFTTAKRDTEFVHAYNAQIGILRQHPEIPVIVPDHLTGNVLPR